MDGGPFPVCLAPRGSLEFPRGHHLPFVYTCVCIVAVKPPSYSVAWWQLVTTRPQSVDQPGNCEQNYGGECQL